MPDSYGKPYVGRPCLYRLPGDRPPRWRCVCPEMKKWKRHQHPWDCLPESDKSERVLSWLKMEFGR